ncbi:MAG: PIN domain-containing protein [Candidatus Symbiothrix sp.]|nr:PIN domain-containing protein [Candidatus Symbiothrix sp.]
MTKYLLDTNICVFFMRGKRYIGERIIRNGLDNCFISEITVGELLYGIECDEINFAENTEKVNELIEKLTVIPITNILQEYAKQKAILRKQGALIDDMDIFIGATAIINDMILVTDNEKHLNRLSNIKIENWIEK